MKLGFGELKVTADMEIQIHLIIGLYGMLNQSDQPTNPVWTFSHMDPPYLSYDVTDSS
jgi:hypothetical protein